MNKHRPSKRLTVTTETLRRLETRALRGVGGAMRSELSSNCPPLPTSDCVSFTAGEVVPCCCF